MTIAAGVLCADGIVIGADSEITMASFKLPGAKVYALDTYPSPKLAITGAGDADFMEYFCQQVADTVTEGMTHRQVRQVLQTCIRSLYEEHIYPATVAGYTDLNTDFIVGVWAAPNTWRLWKTSLTTVVSVRQFHLTGAGVELGRFIADRYLDTLHTINIPMGVLATCATLMHAEEYVRTCGGESHILALVADGRFLPIEAADIERDIKKIETSCWRIARAALCGTTQYATAQVDDLSQQIATIVEAGSIREQTKRTPPNGGDV